MKKARPELPPGLAAAVAKFEETGVRVRRDAKEFRAKIRNEQPETDEERIAREDAAAAKANKAYGNRPPPWLRD